MATGTMTSKGQITIPREIRESLGLKPGTTVVFTPNPDGSYTLSAASRSVLDLQGRLRHTGRALTDTEMEAAIASGAADQG